MYSNSNSFMGGTNTGRPGASPFGSQPSYGQQQQQAPSQFPTQPTGYGAAGLQPQYTGYPGQQQSQLQPQFTGYPPPNGQSSFQQQQQQQPPLPALPQQPFQTGYQPMQPPQQQFPVAQQAPPQAPPRQQPQPTGMTSSQMANSFRSSPAQTVPSQAPPMPMSAKIPNIRLSFITADDQAKFEQLFKSATGNEQAISGDRARDLLMRSKLPGDALSQIWMLADTTKSGQLLFPEFALAMYLCNLKLNNKPVPGALPEKIKNEVSSMVDIISFGVADNQQHAPVRTNAPSFADPPQQSSFASQPVQQPQPQQPSNSQLLSQLVSQPTGFQPPQPFQPQPTSMMSQPTGYMAQPQVSGYQGPRPPMPPMPTGFQNPPALPLNAQPTGRPGQWGLVNAPATGLPNMESLQQQMMPQQGREGGYSTTGLRGNATVPWAITKDEKKIYDNLFRAWDGMGKGFITGSQAIEILGQSGLDKPDLEKIWTLCDPNNRGRLDLDEFAVAMHLIYRKLNGYPVPNRLPPELVPPSTRYLNESLGSIRSLLSKDAEERKNSGAFLEPQKTGVSYLKNHSFSGGANGTAAAARKDATVFKNNDDDFGYRSSARRRMGGGGRSPSPAQSATPPSETADDMSLEQLQKRIREKQVLLDAIDFKDEGLVDQDEALDRKDKRDAEDLFRRIRRLQEDIDAHPKATFRSGDSGAERRTLRRQLQSLTDRLPELASHVRRTEKAISDTKLELFRLKDAKANPTTASAVVGTGPGGAVTESDRLKARARAMMQQRSAALTGKPVQGAGDADAATRRLEEETSKVTAEKDNNDRMVRDVEESVGIFSKGVEDSLKEGAEDKSTEHERRRWEDGLGVEDEVKDFIFDLQRSTRSARIRYEDTSRDRPARATEPDRSVATRVESPAVLAESTAKSTPTATASYNSYKTAEDRAAFIKQQAEQRMAERLAALGLRAPSKPGETVAQRQERERKEKEDRVKQAEAEDAKREQERQRRLADEQISPPSATKSTGKAPPPPPSRGKRADSIQRKQEQEVTEQVIRNAQEASEAETKALEDEERHQEEELRREREATEARRQALEEQVRQGKMKKEEERMQRKAAQRETKEKEERLAAQRAELEAARERERELQRQLEAIDDSSSDDEGPDAITPNGTETTPAASQELPRSVPAPEVATLSQVESVSSPPALSPLATASPPVAGSLNPYHKITSPGAAQADTNPFNRLSMQQAQLQPPASATSATKPDRQRTPSRFDTRKQSADDDWSVVDSRTQDSSDDDDEDGPSGAGSAKHLASILFGTMGPPRPMSRTATGSVTEETPKSPQPSGAFDTPTEPAMSSIPSPPPMPGSFAPPPPPLPSSNAPPPPPMPSAGAPPPPPMPVGGAPPPPPMPTSAPKNPMAGGISGLLGEIQMGKGLKKTVTKDKSAASVAGRVLG